MNEIRNQIEAAIDKQQEILDFSETEISDDDLSLLAQSPRPWIRELILHRCFKITDASVRSICAGNLPGLRRLDFGYSQRITDEGLSQIVQAGFNDLQTLNLSNCVRLTDAGVARLKTMSSLVALNISGCNKLTRTSLLELSVGSLKKLKILEIVMGFWIHNDILKRVSCGFPSLKTLDLAHCGKITDEGIEFLADGLPVLEHLILRNTSITDRGVEILADGRLRSLKKLDLRLCLNLTEKCAELLANGKLKSLEELFIDSWLSDSSLACLGNGNLPNLKSLEVLLKDDLGVQFPRTCEFPSLRRLKLVGERVLGRMLELFSKKAPLLEELEIESSRITPASIERFLKTPMPHLQSLTVMSCSGAQFKRIKKFNCANILNLKTLVISGFILKGSAFKGMLNELEYLEELVVKDSELTTLHLKAALKKPLPNLKTLGILGYQKMTKASAGILAGGNLRSLTTLGLSRGNWPLNDLANGNLSNLEMLFLQDWWEVRDTTLLSLDSPNLPALHGLELDGCFARLPGEAKDCKSARKIFQWIRDNPDSEKTK